jgi:hypothetical protein
MHRNPRLVLRIGIGFLLLLAAAMALPLRTVLSGLGKTAPEGVSISAGVSFDDYSNGLRVLNEYGTANTRRFYQVLDRSRDFQPTDEWFSVPAGVVFHITESIPENTPHPVVLLRSLRDRRSYNYVIDRDGRTWRIVDDLDAAHHSGNSIWSQGDRVYLNLNNSFLGVAFESQVGTPLTPAQIEAGRLLTAGLRARYGIPSENCVTHAQVSVNPSNLRLGYHTDGARGFPFTELGLPNNYNLPPASITDFGFVRDDAFTAAMGGTEWNGIVSAEQIVAEAAEAENVPPADHRRNLQRRFRRLHTVLRLTGALSDAAGDL